MSILERFVDERFLAHRRRSTAVAGQAAVVVAMVLFLWRHYADRVWNFDLLAVGGVFAIVKLGLMAWRMTHD
jgi:hypothetical protein